MCSLSNEPGCCEQDLDVAGPLPYPRTLWTLNPLTEDMVASWNAHTQVPANPTSTPINLPLATSTNGTTTTTDTRLPWERSSWDLHKSREVYLRMRAKWWLGVRTPVVGSSLPRLKVYPWRCDEPLVLDRKSWGRTLSKKRWYNNEIVRNYIFLLQNRAFRLANNTQSLSLFCTHLTSADLAIPSKEDPEGAYTS